MGKLEAAEKRMQEIKIIESDFLESWKANNFPGISDTGAFLGNSFKITPQMTAFILEWIPKMDNKHGSQERLVRALSVTKKAFDGKLLMQLFDDPNSSFYLKWAIGNTMASANVLGVEEWIKKKFMGLTLGKENEMLVYALGKYLEYNESQAILIKIFDEYPLQVADTFARIGEIENLMFLQKKVLQYKGEVQTQIKKAIKKLEKKTIK